jgi:hypothetical protein
MADPIPAVGVNKPALFRSSLAPLEARIDAVLTDDKADVQPVYQKVCKVIDIKEDESYAENGVGGIGSYVVRADGDDFVRLQYKEGEKVLAVPEEKAIGFEVTLQQQELFFKKGVVDRKILQNAGDLRRSGIESKEKACAAYFDNGDDTASPTGVNGQILFDDAQTTLNSTLTFSNVTTTKLSMRALKEMLFLSRSMYNNAGNKMVMRHKLLLVPPTLETEAREILKSMYNPEDSSNRKNTFPERISDPIVWDYLEDPNAFYLIDPAHLQWGVNSIERLKLQLLPGVVNYTNRNVAYDARYRQIAQHFYQWGIIKSLGTTEPVDYEAPLEV